MQIEPYIQHMKMSAGVIRQIVSTVSDEQSCWKPDTESWSILEVLNHLYDTEYLDFRLRLDYILHKLGQTAPEIHPQKWVTERAYNQRKLAPSLQNFLDERHKSLEWLRLLASADWDATMTRDWGSIRAGDMFAAWVAHDLLHIRQLNELQYAWLRREVSPYQVDYAGDW